MLSRTCLLQWAGSCWYYLRYIDPGNAGALVDPEAEKYWMPVDLYVGGAEHAVLHLLYARFWHKVRHPNVLMKCTTDAAQSGPWLQQRGTTGTTVVSPPWKSLSNLSYVVCSNHHQHKISGHAMPCHAMPWQSSSCSESDPWRATLNIPACLCDCIPQVLYDIGAVSTKEPFQRLVSQGMILGETEYSLWHDADGNVVEPETAGAVPVRCGLLPPAAAKLIACSSHAF